jgi:hypothetical protein
MTWTITRDTTNPTDKTIALGKGDEIELTKENREILVQMINGTTNSTIVKNGITILGIFPKFVKVSNNGKADVAYQMNQGVCIYKYIHVQSQSVHTLLSRLQ